MLRIDFQYWQYSMYIRIQSRFVQVPVQDVESKDNNNRIDDDYRRIDIYKL